MADYNTELPIRSQLTGQVNYNDVVVKIADGSVGATQLLGIDSSGRVTVKLDDGLGNAINSQTLSTTQWLQVVEPTSGPVSPGTAASYSSLVGGVYNSTAPTLTTGQQASLQLTASGALIVSATFGGTQTVVGNLTNNNAAPAANNLGVLPALAEATLSASRYTTGDQVLLVTDLAGNTNVDLQYYKGAAVSATNPMMVTLSDGTTAISGAVSAYGTAPTGTEVMGVNAYITNTPTVNQGTSPWIVKDLADGSASGGTAGTFSQLAGGIYNSTAPTLTNGQQASLQLDSAGNLKVNLATAIPAGTNLIGAVNLDIGGSTVSNTNPVPVTITSTTAGTAIQSYYTSASLAAAASATFTYTVAATHTFNLERVWSSASGRIKTVVQNNGSTIFVGFNSTATPNIDMTVITPPLIAAGNTVTVTITNLDLVPFDVYATVEGNQN